MTDTGMNDHELAAALATRAGRLLLDVRTEFADATAEDRKAAGDQRSHEFLMEQLAAARPGDTVLSEEAADDPIRLRSSRVWIVDPLDGTVATLRLLRILSNYVLQVEGTALR